MEYDEYLEEESCPEGFFINECCNCIQRAGIEFCEFCCPFGGVPRCGEERAKECWDTLEKQKQKQIEEYEKTKQKKTLRIDGTFDLKIDQDYPFRASLIANALCGMCTNSKKQMGLAVECNKGHELKYPLLVEKHNCNDYEYEPHFIEDIPSNIIKTFAGELERRKECNECVHLFHGYCSGLRWFPAKIVNNKCEFFRHKDLLCKYAVPYFQYGDTIRNNFCMLDPSKRDKNAGNGNWECNCPHAQKSGVENYDCYIPKSQSLKDNTKVRET